jgi:pimeloyl-ACP methyl ester carboxylesterase
MRWLRAGKAIAVGAALPVAMAGSSAAGPVVVSAQTADSQVRTDEICFTVNNRGDPVPSRVYGVRYYVGEPGPHTKVIVVVHGASVTHSFWDVRPDFSVARHLAEAGYMVVAYDRLGFGKSPYTRSRGAGYTLTLSSQRGMLHEIVTQLKQGSYRFSSNGTCSPSNGVKVGLASSSVILIGHSTGGAIVSGYPGTYHDMVAVVQTGFNNQGLPPAAAVYAATTLGPQLATGDDYAVAFPTSEDCERTLLYPPGVVPALGVLPTSQVRPHPCRGIRRLPGGGHGKPDGHRACRTDGAGAPGLG